MSCIHYRHSELADALDSCEYEGEIGATCGAGCPGYEEVRGEEYERGSRG